MKNPLLYVIIISIGINSLDALGDSAPLASFTVSDSTGCIPLNVSFINNSQNGVNYLWDFGNGSTSSLQNPSVIYNYPGIFTVKLIVTSQSGDKDTAIKTNLVVAHANPTANFSIPNNTGCVGTSVSFLNTSYGAIGYVWDFGDGNISNQTNPVHVYSSSGTYSISLIATSAAGCMHVKTMQNYVIIAPTPSGDFIVDTTRSCDLNKPFFFNSTVSGAINYQWDFGDGYSAQVADPVHTYTQGGSFAVTMTAANSYGCSVSVTKQDLISVSSQLNPSVFATQTTGCAPLTVTFLSNPAGNYTYAWDFGDGHTSSAASPAHMYSDTGNYDVALSVTNFNNCTFTVDVPDMIQVTDQINISFTADYPAGCRPLNVSFTPSFIGASAYYWEFSDGTTSALQAPSHIFPANGNYSVSLKVTGTNGCVSNKSMANYIHVTSPAAAFTLNNSTGCRPLTPTFNALSPAAVAWTWDFGDGTGFIAGNSTESHAYTDSGVFDVTLIVQDAQGCTDTIRKNNIVTVIAPLIVFNNPDTITSCTPITVTFDGTSLGQDYWLWDFGDGVTSSMANPQHVYLFSGTYPVTLNTVAANGCPVTIFDYNVYRIEIASVNFSFVKDSCPSYGVQFFDSSGGVQSVLWDFGDGITSTDPNPHHVYSGSGNVAVTLYVTTTGGCMISSVKFCKINSCITGGAPADSLGGFSGFNDWIGTGVNDSMNSLFDTITGCSPLSVQFTSPTDDAVSWLWDFGDGYTSADTNPSHIYTLNGTYSITLMLTYNDGSVDTLIYSRKISISGADAAFTFIKENTCTGADVHFDDLYDSPSYLQWSFGDGALSAQTDPLHSYSAPGNYLVSHQVADAFGCRDFEINNLFVGTIIPLFDYTDTICVYDTAMFRTTISNYAAYIWDFGDGTTSGELSPQHKYNAGGEYTVTLTVTDSNNCTTTFGLPLPVVVHQPVASFMVSGSITGCNELNIAPANTSTGSTAWQWNFGDGTTSAQKNPVHLYDAPGIYSLSLIVSKGGCYDTLIWNDSIVIHYASVDFHYVQTGYCLPVTVAFTDSSHSPVSWAWGFGDGETSNDPNPVHIYDSHPEGNIELTITDSNGCTLTVEKPHPSIFKPDAAVASRKGCLPFTVTFNDNTNSAVSWQWDFGDGSASSLQNPVHTFDDTGYYSVTLIAMAPQGCYDTAYFDSLIYVQQVIAAFSSPSLLEGCNPLLVNFTDKSHNAQKWQWDFGDGGTAVIKNPVHVYTYPGNYSATLIASSNIGCSDTFDLSGFIEVTGPYAQFIISDTSGCPPLEVKFTDQSINADNIEWYFGDGDTATTPIPVHLFNASGDYFVTLFAEDITGCKSWFTFPLPISVFPVPEAVFTLSDSVGCAPEEITFANYSTDGFEYLWDFGDMNGSMLGNPVHVYNEPGVYIPSLIVTNLLGCTDTMIRNPLPVYRAPGADFAVSTASGCAPVTVQMSNTSTGLDNPVFEWIFGNGLTSGEENPTVQFPEAGNYTITLIVSNQGICSDTLTKDNLIHVIEDIPSPSPEIFTVSVTSDTSVYILWGESTASDFASYVLYRKNIITESYEPIATFNDRDITSFADNHVNTLQNSYCYKLLVTDTCGNAVPVGDLKTHCTINLTAYTYKDFMRVEWTPYVGCPVTSYELFRGDKKIGTIKLHQVFENNELSFDDNEWECNGDYIYRVRAVGLCGRNVSSYSDTAGASPEDMSFLDQRVPLVRTTIINNNSTLTEWKEPELAPDKVMKYKIYRSYDGEEFNHYTTVPAGTFLFMDEEVDLNHQTYYYLVQPEYTCLFEAPSSNRGSTILLKGKTKMDHVELEWNEYKDWEGGVKHYIIERLTEDGRWETIEVTDGKTTKFTDRVEE